MFAAKKIKLLLVERDMTMTDLAEKLNTGKSNLSQKMQRNNFSEKELKEIAEVLNCDYDIVFTMKDTRKQI
jgi:transcriptional regulator with XRE-family HTH domain